MNKELYQLLLQSLDQSLTLAEQKRLDEGLHTAENLRQEKVELERIRQELGDVKYHFDPFFAGKVMNRIEQMEKGTQSRGNGWIVAFRQVALPGLAVLILLLIVTWLSEGSISLEAMTGISDLYQEDVLAQYNTFDIDIK